MEQNNKIKNDNNNKNIIFKIKNLKVFFEINEGFFEKKTLKAVNDITLEIKKNEILCIVGESGCGKTTLGKTILNIHKPTSGDMLFYDRNIKDFKKNELKELKSKIQMIFQDSYSSLDPFMTVEDAISEPLDIHNEKYKTKKEKRERVLKLLSDVNLSIELLHKHPSELSGGQAQRVNIARSLALNPELIVCDEPTSALDVSVQAQIINTFLELKKKLNLTYIFITHNLLLVKHIANRVVVMYLGKIIEIANSNELFKNPLHPYTKLLMNSILIPEPEIKNDNKNNILMNDDFPSPFNVPSGCPFRTRCPNAEKKCETILPELKEIKKNHYVACILINK